MTDSGLVIATHKDLAEVEVSCFESCHSCSARHLCIGNSQNKGRISVKNPMHAMPGDKVKIQIPETQYSRSLILLFGGLLLALLAGLGGGWMASVLLILPLFPASLIGFAAGLILGGLALVPIFRRKNENQLYPVIIDILTKGDLYG